MTEPNKPLNQMSAQERLDLGLSYLGEGRFDEAIKALSSIRREKAGPGTYAQAQLGLGVAYAESGEREQAIKILSSIRREEAGPGTYAGAQFGLGVAYEDQGKLDDAIAVWSNIHREDNPEAYAGAQFGLGIAYEDQGKLDDAITAWSNIRRDDDSKTYADAQLNLGIAYHTQDQLDEAITAWKKVREDDPETYAKAQLNLGIAYHTQDQLDDAITAWKKVREDDPETYAKAQLNLGAAYYAQGKAQFNLGNTYKAQGKLDDAITAWKKVREDDPETYAKAQLNLGKIYEDEGDLERAKEAYYNAQDFSYYDYERVTRILNCPPELSDDLRSLAKNTDEVLKYLQIIPGFESKVAHYTRPQIAFDLFEGKKNDNDKEPSNFRLSTIRGVNDPTEGLVLNGYWNQQGILETIHINDTATFISCFTFKHDSLNQFRLYGKENGQEATGVSLVFNEEFFSDQSDVLKFIAGPSTDPSSKSEQIKLNDTGKPESDNKKQLIAKSALYRCIYLDPETGYWTLAQRDKSTFYRKHNGDGDTQEKWDKYYDELIPGKEENVEQYLFDKENNKIKSISYILKSIFTDKSQPYNKCNKDEKQKILEAVRFILLPLQYLVKHIAFQEEQECRIMYITQFRDEKIHSNREKQWMYVEYEEKVLPHIDKIWLSPGAAKYQDFFRILLDKGENDDKVRISQNPFRNKE